MTSNAFDYPPPDAMVNLARNFSSEAVMTLVNLMRTAKSEQVRLSAAKEILSRGYGRASKAAVASADVALPDAPPPQAAPEPAPAPAPERRRQPLPRVARGEADDALPPLPMVAALMSDTALINRIDQFRRE